MQVSLNRGMKTDFFGGFLVCLWRRMLVVEETSLMNPLILYRYHQDAEGLSRLKVRVFFL